MPGPLTSVVTAVNARIATLWRALYPATYATTDILTTVSGADQVRQQATPPRVVWVPTEEVFGPPVGQGGDFMSMQASPLLQPPVQPIATRYVSVEVHIWGRSQDETETLLGILDSAAYACCYGSYSRLRGLWVSDAGAVDIVGWAYIFNLQFAIPVVRDTNEITNRVITALPITGEADFANGAVVTPV